MIEPLEEGAEVEEEPAAGYSCCIFWIKYQSQMGIYKK